ncbi:MAG: DinB family protein [Acidobacteriota bacterium]
MSRSASPSILRCYRRIVAQNDRMIAILDGAGPSLDARREELSAWDVAQHLEHLGITSTLTLDLFRAFAADGGQPPGATSGSPNFWGHLVLWTGRIPRGRGRARPEWKPRDSSPERARELIEEVRRRLPALARKLGEIEASDHRVRHPVLGDFTGRQWVRFLFIHQRHHLRFIEDIAKGERRTA